MSIVRGELFVASCPRVVVVLDHPVTFECPCWTMFKRVMLQCLLMVLYFIDFWQFLYFVSIFIFAEVGIQFVLSNLSLPGKDHPNLI